MLKVKQFNRLGGVAMIVTTIAMVVYEFQNSDMAAYLAMLATALGLLCFFPAVSWTRKAFVLIGLVAVFVSSLYLPDWQQTALMALQRASFIAAFFTALAAIRSAASVSRSMAVCGRFLAGQPPGRRYFALMVGGHLFGLVLMYGSISLLGTLATDSAAKEANIEIRKHRTRRMLVAIQRGFISTLTWSPLGFAMAITLTLVPGAQWSDVVIPCLISSAILLGVGWGLDSAFKPRLSVPAAPHSAAENDWLKNLTPLIILLGTIIGVVFVIHLLSTVRIVGIVMVTVPLIAMLWVALKPPNGNSGGRLDHTYNQIRRYTVVDLPSYGPELVLLMMAGFIGTVGASLALPLMKQSGIDLAAVPAPLLLVGIIWLLPLAGQLGMNPILTTSLFAPLLPAPAALGISPTSMLLAITSAWALTGATSPFTATTLLVGRFGEISAREVGIRWNGVYALCCGVVLSLWVGLSAGHI